METRNREKNKNQISSIIAEILEENFILEENAKLVEDIGLDSMGFLELAIKIQRTFGTLIPNDEWKNIITIKDLLDTIEKKSNENE
jgi:acyl carrier protein